MGRAKIQMELIKSEKARQATLKARKSGLKKKIQELSTLCDVKIGMIMYEPKKDEKPVEPEILPTDPNEIQELFNSYIAQPDDDRTKRTTDLMSFFKERNERLETNLMKQRMKNSEAKYPTWDKRYDDLSEEQLREIAHILDTKIEAAKPRFRFCKNYQMLASSSGTKVYSNCYASEFLLRNEFDRNFRPQVQQQISEARLLDMNYQTGEEGALNAKVYSNDYASEFFLRTSSKEFDWNFNPQPEVKFLDMNYQKMESSSGAKVYSNDNVSEILLRTSSNEFDWDFCPQPEVKFLDTMNGQSGQEGALNAEVYSNDYASEFFLRTSSKEFDWNFNPQPEVKFLDMNYQKMESSSGAKVYSNDNASEALLRTSSNEFDRDFCPQPEVKFLDTMNGQSGQEGALNANYTMTNLMNGDKYALFDHEMHSSNFMHTPMPLNGPRYSDNMPGIFDYMMGNNSSDVGPADWDSGLTMQRQLPLPQYGQCPKMDGDGYYDGIFRS